MSEKRIESILGIDSLIARMQSTMIFIDFDMCMGMSKIEEKAARRCDDE